MSVPPAHDLRGICLEYWLYNILYRLPITIGSYIERKEKIILEKSLKNPMIVADAKKYG